MANMSYCRWENTLGDLRDCEDYLFDELSPRESRARRSLIRIAARMLVDLGADIDLEDLLSVLPEPPDG